MSVWYSIALHLICSTFGRNLFIVVVVSFLLEIRVFEYGKGTNFTAEKVSTKIECHIRMVASVAVKAIQFNTFHKSTPTLLSMSQGVRAPHKPQQLKLCIIG